AAPCWSPRTTWPASATSATRRCCCSAASSPAAPPARCSPRSGWPRPSAWAAPTPPRRRDGSAQRRGRVVHPPPAVRLHVAGDAGQRGRRRGVRGAVLLDDADRLVADGRRGLARGAARGGAVLPARAALRGGRA